MATNGKAPKPTRDSDARRLDRNNWQGGTAEDRLLGLAKLVGRKPPQQGGKS